LVSPSLPQPLTTVSDNSDMYVYFSMTENQLLALTRQYGSMDEALKNMPAAELRLNDNSVYDKKGTIESISGVIDRQTGTVVARVVFPNESRLLHSGASGTVVVPATYKNCIVIPQEATVQLQDKTLVYKVVDGKAVSTLITVAGINDGREYVVLDGLKVGDEIVSTGAGLLREGTQVK
jgi:membrane fusion protein (multidrug efflux system)